MRKVAFITLGCKVNTYETEGMKRLFEKSGYLIVEPEDCADVYVINTCTVTHLSDRKSRQMIRRAKRLNPNAVIAVVGCLCPGGTGRSSRDRRRKPGHRQ